jgi:hypothetical protein
MTVLKSLILLDILSINAILGCNLGRVFFVKSKVVPWPQMFMKGIWNFQRVED